MDTKGAIESVCIEQVMLLKEEKYLLFEQKTRVIIKNST